MRPVVIAIVAALVSSGQEGAGEPSGLGMSKAVACKRVDGLEDFVVLPEASLTSEDKLKVYFRPLHYKVEKLEKPGSNGLPKYRARFTEDGRVRRKGEKTPLSKEDKLLDYETTFDTPDYQIYLVNNIGLKNLPPGDYEFEIILHDGLVEGSTARQVLPFTIVATPKAETPEAPKAAPGAAKSSKGKAKPKAKGSSIP